MYGNDENEKMLQEKDRMISLLQQDILDLQTQIQMQKEMMEVNSRELDKAKHEMVRLQTVSE